MFRATLCSSSGGQLKVNKEPSSLLTCIPDGH